MSALPVRGGFLDGIKLEDATKFNPAQLHPENLRPTLDRITLMDLKLKLEQVQEQIANISERVEGVYKGDAIETKAVEATASAQHAVASVFNKGAEAAHEKLEGVSAGADLRKGEAIVAKAEEAVVDAEHVAGGLVKESTGAAANSAIKEAEDVVEGLHSGRRGADGAIRGVSSWMADAVNQTSLHFSEVLSSFSPKASAMLRRSGEAWACKLSGDCGQHDAAPFEIENPESWAVWVFALLLLLTVCATFTVVFGCTYAVVRKGKGLLSEALVPLTEASAREPTLQMSTQSVI